MNNQMTPKEMDSLSALILVHTQKMNDYTRAVPNVGLVKRHKEFVETLMKAQTLLRGDPVTCASCVRDGKGSSGCDKCGRNPGLTDNFKRRKA